MSSDCEPLTIEDVVETLAATLGSDKSREVVDAAALTLGAFDADAVLRVLGEQPGIVGVAARFARTRMARRAASLMSRAAAQSEAPPRPNPGPAQPSGRPEQKRTIRRRAVTDLLAPSLGDDASATLVDAELRRLGINGDEIDVRTAMRLLDALAALPGLAGIAARFAKARIILLFSFETASASAPR